MPMRGHRRSTRWRARGVLFSQAASPAPLTLPAHCLDHDGAVPHVSRRAPERHHRPQPEPDDARRSRSRSAGYQTGAFIGAFVLDGRWGLNQGFGVYDDQFDLKKFKHLDLAAVQRPGERGDGRGARIGSTAAGTGRSSPGSISTMRTARTSRPSRSAPSSAAAGPRVSMTARSRLRINRSVECSRGSGRAGLDEQTMIVIVGDHGEGLGSHGEGTHGFFVYDYALHVPFIVATPDRRRCRACASTRRSASSTCSRPCSRSPGSIPRPESMGARSLPLMFQARAAEPRRCTRTASR